MLSLTALQREFQRYVLGARSRPATHRMVANQPDAGARLAIYANAYRLRLSAALVEDYPKLNALLGAREFARLSQAYIARFPSHDPNIRWAGRHMPAFLRAQLPYRSNPVLGELAELERALRDAFDAPDVPVVGSAAVAAIPARRWPSMRAGLHPSVRRLDLNWNTVVVWQALDSGNAPPSPRRLPAPVAWVVWRKALNPTFRSLLLAEARALDDIRAGADMQALCETARQSHAPEQVPSHVARWLAQWLADGMVTHVDG